MMIARHSDYDASNISDFTTAVTLAYFLTRDELHTSQHACSVVRQFSLYELCSRSDTDHKCDRPKKLPEQS